MKSFWTPSHRKIQVGLCGFMQKGLKAIAIIFCFFISDTIVYDIPPPILNSELKIHLASREADWEARSELEWREARRNAQPESHFRSSFALLFAEQNDKSRKEYSLLAGYTLILVLITAYLLPTRDRQTQTRLRSRANSNGYSRRRASPEKVVERMVPGPGIVPGRGFSTRSNLLQTLLPWFAWPIYV